MSKKLLFLQTEDWSFWSHRLPLARAAKAAGYDVVVALRVDAHGERLRAEGFRVIPLDWQRAGVHPIRELRMLWSVIRLYAREKPDLAHQVTAKPILYGSLAAWLAGTPAVVNAFTGLGFVFISETMRAKVLRAGMKTAYKLALAARNSRTVFQNADDLDMFVARGLVAREKTALIRGSGVDVAHYSPRPEPPEPPLVVLPARILWSKGVAEFVAAARELLAAGVKARFALVGDPDVHNRSAVSAERLADWKASGDVEVWGHRADMMSVYAQAHVVCLPSYHEGLPKALMEAAATGRALVAADVPGCREVVRNEETGLLVPVKDAAALAKALRRLIEDRDLRGRLGARARRAAVEEFAQELIAEQTLGVYRELLTGAGAGASSPSASAGSPRA
jgi:glycosyltransferase involved in cell wall biosynthesis